MCKGRCTKDVLRWCEKMCRVIQVCVSVWERSVQIHVGGSVE